MIGDDSQWKYFVKWAWIWFTEIITKVT
jgi:hypothetical protein